MNDQFYLTLPSNSSFSIFPENTTTCFTTQLPQRINLKGDWEVGLVEFFYPQSIQNVYAKNNYLYSFNGSNIKKTEVIPGGFTTPADLVGVINSSATFKNNFRLDLRNKEITVTKLNTADESIYNVGLHPDLSFLLGFDPSTNFAVAGKNKRPINAKLGIVNQMYMYCDIVQPQLVGDSSVSLLRIIHVDKINYEHGSSKVVTYEVPHYVPVMKTEFQTVTIDIRDDIGEKIPFTHGTSCAKLHFRRQRRLHYT